MTKDDALYKARLYHDKAVTKQIEEDLQVMVRALIGDYKLEISIMEQGKPYDQYPSCKNQLKKFCPAKPAKYQAYLRGHGYVFFGNSKIDIYCKIIAAIAGNKIYLPYSVLPEQKREDESDEEAEQN